MSTRYVWDKTYAKQIYTAQRRDVDTSQFQGPFASDTSFVAGSSYTLNQDTGKFSINSGRTYTNSYVYSQTNHTVQISVPSAKYLKAGSSDNAVYEGATSTMLTYKWDLRALDGIDGDIDASILGEYGGYGSYTEITATTTTGSGSHVEYLSGGSKNAYTAGVDSTGTYYLVYLGADSIDPKSIQFLNTEPHNGIITVELTPATNVLADSQIYYQYQYSIDNGTTWVDAGDKTTSTQKEIEVPSSADYFMVRAQASDDIGFTSTTYVTSNNIKVQTMRLWVGVDNKARAGKRLWVGVDGKARRVVRAWVGDDNGKARRWF